MLSARGGAVLSVLRAQHGAASIQAVEMTNQYLLLFCRYLFYIFRMVWAYPKNRMVRAYPKNRMVWGVYRSFKIFIGVDS